MLRKTCRQCCNTTLLPILSLGTHAVSTFLDPSVGNEVVTRGPLELVLCDPRTGCSLLQLHHRAVDPAVMFTKYWYKSGMNKTMIAALRDITKKIEDMSYLSAGDAVLDIGSNDGTLLRSYATEGLRKIGFEPARNLAHDVDEAPGLIINDFFSAAAFEREVVDTKVKAVTSIAMFYALENPAQFVADVKRILRPDGVWVIQMAYLPSMLETNNVDNICHEHVTYYSLRSLEFLLHSHGLQVFDLELNDVNGGSFRVYVQHPSLPCSRLVTDRVAAQREYESKYNFQEADVYRAFAQRVEDIKVSLVTFLKREHARGKIIHVYGASTKGNTLLQYFGLDASIIQAAAERNPDKWGLKTVATLIPIISEAQSRESHPDYYLVLPWHFRTEFVQRESEYLAKGGHMIFPLPRPEVVGLSGSNPLS